MKNPSKHRAAINTVGDFLGSRKLAWDWVAPGLWDRLEEMRKIEKMVLLTRVTDLPPVGGVKQWAKGWDSVDGPGI